MSQVRITIDSETILDAQLSMTTGDLPDLNTLRDKLTPAKGGFSTWSATVIGILGAELLAGKAAGTIPNLSITVTTRDDGYEISVTTHD